ncbi:hypothetical protein GW793_02490 [bacterium]|nr:hypothetical protein [bacterium]
MDIYLYDTEIDHPSQVSFYVFTNNIKAFVEFVEQTPFHKTLVTISFLSFLKKLCT